MRRFRKLIFHLERFLLRGAIYQLLLIAGLLLLVSVTAGGILYLFVPEPSDFWDSVWWGFLRLSDPGYLGDDAGLVKRTVSTVVTILGYVLFMGALVAIMTQGLYRTISRLEAGLTPITEKGHIIILGWTNRTSSIIREILLAEGRVKRFLKRTGTKHLNIVILAQEVNASLVYDLKDELGPDWDAKKIVFRSGSPLKLEHLARVDFLNASAIILPASNSDADRTDSFDSKVMKILMGISNSAAAQSPPVKPPLLVAEIFDPRKTALARGSYNGNVEIVPSSSIISRLIAQNVRHSGLSHVFRELLTHGSGNEIYIREYPELAGESFGALAEIFPQALPLGLVRERNGEPFCYLNPPADLPIEEDRLVFIARSYAATELTAFGRNAAVPEASRSTVKIHAEQRKVLILGWGSKLPVLLSEFDSYEQEKFSIDVMSIKPVSERKQFLKRFGQLPRSTEVRHIDGDYTSPSGLSTVTLSDYRNIVYLSSDWLTSESEADARTILGYQLLRTELAKLAPERQPRILIELMDPENEPLFQARVGEVLVSPVIISHMMGHIALRPALRIVFEELFTAGGAEIYFHPQGEYLSGFRQITFSDLQKRVAARGNIALGFFRPSARGDTDSDQLVLNPPKETLWDLRDEDEIVVLTTYSE